MNKTSHIASYIKGDNKVILYTDRIEFGTSSLNSYRYEEIKYAAFVNYIIGTSLILVLWNGNESTLVHMSNKDAKVCQPQLEQFINSSQQLSGDTDDPSIRCTYLGGSGTSLVKGDVCLVVFGKDTVNIMSGAKRIDIKLNQLTALKLEGPGRVTTNAGVMGGGFGLEGAALGIGAAALLNTLTTKTKTNTIVYLAWPDAELFLHTSKYNLDEARLLLSRTFIATQSINDNGGIDLASQLERLASLKNSGALTDEEYSLAKSKLIDGMR